MNETLEKLLESNNQARQVLDTISTTLTRMAGNSRTATGPAKKKDKDEEESKGGGIGGVIGGLGKAVAAISGLVFAASAFVKALNPGLVAQFSFELRGLTATIGSALEPVISNVIPIIRQLAAMAFDLTKELRPLIDEISQAIGARIAALAHAFAVVLKLVIQVLAPFIRHAMAMENIFTQLIEVFTAFISALIDTIQAFFSAAPLDVLFKLMESSISKSIVALAHFTARLLVAFGATGLVAKMADNLRKRIADIKNPKGGLVGAPQGASTGGIDDIARRFAERAFTASGSTKAAASQTELLTEILKELDDAQKDPQTWTKIIEDAINNAIPDWIRNPKIPSLPSLPDIPALPSSTGPSVGGWLGGAAGAIAGPPGIVVGGRIGSWIERQFE